MQNKNLKLTPETKRHLSSLPHSLCFYDLEQFHWYRIDSNAIYQQLFSQLLFNVSWYFGNFPRIEADKYVGPNFKICLKVSEWLSVFDQYLDVSFDMLYIPYCSTYAH